MLEANGNITRAYLSALDQVSQRAIPATTLARAKESLLDYFAVTLAGSKFFEEKLARYFQFTQPEPGDFLALGTGRKLAQKEAVFLNGLNAHALDFDDGVNTGIIHLGSPVFTVLLAVGQRVNASLDAILRAAIIGYEASFTMAVSIQPGHKLLGYHATGTCGTLGATLAGCYLLGFNEEERFNALAIAAISAGGMLRALDDGSEMKPYNVAKTTVMALTSMELAKAGFRGHYDVFAGERGFFKMMTGSPEVQMYCPLLDGRYAIDRTYTKPYASCRYTHPAIECAIRIGKTASPEEIEALKVRTYSLAVNKHDHVDIPGSASAKMSIPYSVAVALRYGKAGLQEFDQEHVADAANLSLTRKVQVESDEEFSASFPRMQTATLEATLKDGRVLTERVDFPKGEPENPLNEEEFKTRYLGLTSYAAFEESRAQALYDLVKTDANATLAQALELLA